MNWINLRDSKNFRSIPDEEEVLLGSFDDQRVMENYLKEIPRK